MSTLATVDCRRVMSQDVVLFASGGDLCAGKLHFHAEVDGVCWSCVSPWGATGTAGKWRVLAEPRMIPTRDIKESVIYSAVGVGQIAPIIRCND